MNAGLPCGVGLHGPMQVPSSLASASSEASAAALSSMDRAPLEQCLCVTLMALALVMAGTGGGQGQAGCVRA